MKADHAYRVKIANGIVEMNQMIPTRLGFDGVQNIHVLKESPPALSLGELCIEGGYAFVWLPSAKVPGMIRPQGKSIPLRTIHNVPYFVEEDLESS